MEVFDIHRTFCMMDGLSSFDFHFIRNQAVFLIAIPAILNWHTWITPFEDNLKVEIVAWHNKKLSNHLEKMLQTDRLGEIGKTNCAKSGGRGGGQPQMMRSREAPNRYLSTYNWNFLKLFFPYLLYFPWIERHNKKKIKINPRRIYSLLKVRPWPVPFLLFRGVSPKRDLQSFSSLLIVARFSGLHRIPITQILLQQLICEKAQKLLKRSQFCGIVSL